VSTFMPTGPSYREVLSLPEMTDEQANEMILRERAAHAKQFASPGWYDQFVRGQAGWGVTAERVYLMATLHAFETIRLLIGRGARACAPKAYIINLDEPEYLVRIASPPNGRCWNYREF